ncbi:MAG: hypothetical protein NUW37_01070 [Planctomycetes bacterium]|nr:hypothetical protein [Planctomycetota bacterium]
MFAARLIVAFIALFAVSSISVAYAGDEAPWQFTAFEKKLGAGLTKFPVDQALQDKIDAAVDKGTNWLLTQQKPDGHFDIYMNTHVMGGTALCLLALVHSGVIEREDRRIQKGIEWLYQQYLDLKAHDLLRTYDIGVTLMLLEVRPVQFNPRRTEAQQQRTPLELDWIKEMVAWIEEKRNSSGFWSYPHGQGDHSNSQYALLGLSSAARMTVDVSTPEFYIPVLNHFLDTQDQSGPAVPPFGPTVDMRSTDSNFANARGWNYQEGWLKTGSMTTAGVVTLAVIHDRLTELDGRRRRFYDLQLQGRTTKSIFDGLGWLGKYFSVERNPAAPSGDGGWHYYYLYGLERAGALTGQEWFGQHDWYKEGAQYLVDHQLDDGKWDTNAAGNLPAHIQAVQDQEDHPFAVNQWTDTCYAILFLKKATKPVPNLAPPPVTQGH